MLIFAIATVGAAAEPPTKNHRAGYCALKGQEKKSWFGGQLPVVDNSPAETPDRELRDKVVEICGVQFEDTPLCCDGAQVCRSFVVF